MSRPLRVLYVAYPLLPVSEESAGGAEQMLWTLEREMFSRGHSTVTAACEGSVVSGEVFATGGATTEPDRFEDRAAEHEAQIVEYVWAAERAGKPIELIHDKSGHFWKQASAVPVPVLATLHLPRHFYREEWFQVAPDNLIFNCVSRAQAKTFADLPRFPDVIENGIDVSRFTPSGPKSAYILWIGRICEEKGAHVAIEVAQQAGLPLVLAGDVYPFSYHQNYFTREILPRLENAKVEIKFVQKPRFEEKLSLLRGAMALVQPALVDETSSLVAMEAMACGTPVVAFRRGALREVVADGETGFIVDSADDMIEGLGRVHEINPCACRRRVEERFSARRMADGYEALYERVLRREKQKNTARQQLTPGNAA